MRTSGVVAPEKQCVTALTKWTVLTMESPTISVVGGIRRGRDDDRGECCVVAAIRGVVVAENCCKEGTTSFLTKGK